MVNRAQQEEVAGVDGMVVERVLGGARHEKAGKVTTRTYPRNDVSAKRVIENASTQIAICSLWVTSGSEPSTVRREARASNPVSSVTALFAASPRGYGATTPQGVRCETRLTELGDFDPPHDTDEAADGDSEQRLAEHAEPDRQTAAELARANVHLA